MRNFRHKGETCTFLAPYAVASGGGFLVGALFAVANSAAAQGAEVEGDTVGVMTLPKSTAAGTAVTPGLRAYWDDAAKVVTKTVGANTLIGAFMATAADGAADVSVRLNGGVV